MHVLLHCYVYAAEFSVMSRDSSKGNAPVTMVTSVP